MITGSMTVWCEHQQRRMSTARAGRSTNSVAPNSHASIRKPSHLPGLSRSVLLLTVNIESRYTAVDSPQRHDVSPSPADVPYGTLDLMVLKTLHALGPLHGYGIARRIEQIAQGSLALNQGTIYPALLRLEQKGWLPVHGGPARTTGVHAFIRSPEPVASNSRLRQQAGNGPSPWSTGCWSTSRDVAPRLAVACARIGGRLPARCRSG
jgi:hypothetical protein